MPAVAARTVSHRRYFLTGAAAKEDYFRTAQVASNPSLSSLRSLRLTPNHSTEFWYGGYVSEPFQPYLQLDGLEHLAASPHLQNLRELRFAASDAGDAGIEVLIRSGMLFRLEVLDLSYGQVTDGGARTLVDMPGATERHHPAEARVEARR